MGDQRAYIESDLRETLESDFSLPVELINPNGTRQTISALDPELELPLVGQILYDSTVQDSDTGLDIVVHKPVVTLRRASLVEIPVATPGTNWACLIPISPRAGAPVVSHRVHRVTEGGDSIGFVRLYLELVRQSP